MRVGGGGGWRKQRAEAGSETVFMVQLGELMALWDRENGKMGGWVRVKICLLKGSCHLPPLSMLPHPYIPAMCKSPQAESNKATGWSLQPVEALALGRPGSLPGPKASPAQPGEGKSEAQGFRLERAQPVGACHGRLGEAHDQGGVD